MTTCDVVPDLLTIEEAALVLRVGRTVAYAQARVWRATNGATGLPNIGVGGQHRVPRAGLEEVIGGPITHLPDVPSRRRDRRRPALGELRPPAGGRA